MPIDKLLRDEVPVPRAIAHVLEEAGIDLIFGIPGGRTGAIFDALYDYRRWRRRWPPAVRRWSTSPRLVGSPSAT